MQKYGGEFHSRQISTRGRGVARHPGEHFTVFRQLTRILVRCLHLQHCIRPRPGGPQQREGTGNGTEKTESDHRADPGEGRLYDDRGGVFRPGAFSADPRPD